MGPPAVASYPMPARAEVPSSAATWTIDPARAALLVLDMQRHHLGRFPASDAPTEQLVGNVGALRELAGVLAIPIVFGVEQAVRQPDQRGVLGDLWGPGITDAADAALIDTLAPRAGEHVVVHTRPNAFLGSQLERTLRGHGRDQLIVCGLFAGLGVLLTSADAVMHGIQPFVVADAVADLTAEKHTGALRWMAVHSAVVTRTEQLLRAG
ncbi:MULTISPECIES: isochorismatase family protein [unclassified Streptomyces]|uniref:isochorismatase family protein n=1 Tax=unclassified Streptomyces TaxID=2593676 RepID=UPI000823CFFB|nr:isochorismatase family protein [Streptomyces sp. AmelKG-E11A]SCK53948.1 bifunctional isochorismate lyase / aryl carrier protein [Streptomyces sp. AmelKG-E11A]